MGPLVPPPSMLSLAVVGGLVEVDVLLLEPLDDVTAAVDEKVWVMVCVVMLRSDPTDVLTSMDVETTTEGPLEEPVLVLLALGLVLLVPFVGVGVGVCWARGMRG